MTLRPLFPVLVPAAAAALYGWAVFVTTFSHPGAIGLDYNAPGTDWMVLYSVIRLAMACRFDLTRDGAEFTAYLNGAFAHWLSQPLFFRAWVYPPSLLVLLLPFGALGFIASYVIFQLATAALLAGALLCRPEQRRAAGLIAAGALACPAASVNVVDGQCGFLIAGLLILGVRLVPDRPLLAGAVLGLLSVKPQFALMAPVALIAMRQWRGLSAGALSAVALAAVSAIAFGPRLWMWWVDQTAGALGGQESDWVAFGRLWGSSVYACAILLGAPPLLGSLAQAGATLAAAAGVYGAYRSPLGADRRLAVFLACTFLAAPHISTYDALLLTIAGGLWMADQAVPRPGQAIVVLVLWLSPLLGPPAIVPIGRLLPLFVGAFIVLALTGRFNARSECGPPAAAPSG